MPPPAPPRTSPYAITALVTGIIGIVPIAVGYGIAALVQVRRRTHTGRNLAIGGLAAALFWVVVGVASASGSLLSAFTVERDASGAITDGGRVHFASLQKGDCYTGFDPDADEVMFVKAVPCSEPHRGEITARLPVGPAKGFGTGPMFDRADLYCHSRTEWVGKSRLYPDLYPYVYLPEPGGSTSADSEGKVVCAMHYTGSGTLDGPLAETVEADRRIYDELEAGDCVAEIEEGGESAAVGSVKLLPCDAAHRYQVFATFDLPENLSGSAQAPSQKLLDQKGEQECDRRSDAPLRNAPQADYGILWVVPTEASWSLSREVVCFVGLMDGAPLRKSIVGG
ncbi:DUF4190 domain-containing protein [Actinomadura sediminis]|uniref:Septum formation family protein n=1 Tax=Actinomadura sediminis TaxID=1038904 RepID=A0ABW3EK55_9ACTN